MKIRLSELRNIVRVVFESTRDDYVVRGGSEVLVRSVDGLPSDWTWETLDKVTYFTKKELVKAPRGPMDRQYYEFVRDNKRYSIPASCMYLVPSNGSLSAGH